MYCFNFTAILSVAENIIIKIAKSSHTPPLNVWVVSKAQRNVKGGNKLFPIY